MDRPAEIFVGRAGELAALARIVDDARAGRGGVALLTGEPGIGKSRLADEVARTAATAGFIVAWGRGWEGAGTPAFWLFTQALRTLASHPQLRGCFDDDELAAILEPSARHDEPADAETARFRLYDVTTRALKQASRRAPLLLVLDDAHAADAASLALLHFAARGLRDASIAVVVTMREAPFATHDEAPGLLARIAREATHVPLPRLAHDELAGWVARVDERLPVEPIWRASEGNPLFVDELLKAARHRPGSTFTAAQLPLGVRAAVQSHLALLSAPALRVAEIASILGREPSTIRLRALLGAVGAEAELHHIDEAIAVGVVHDLGDGRLRFAHVLVRDELEAHLSEERCRTLHRAAAAVFDDVATSAHHALLGADRDDASAVLARVREAMRDAAARLAHEDAARIGRRALDALTRFLPDADGCALRVDVAEALVFAGDVRGGQAEARVAARLARDTKEPALFARATLVLAAELRFVGDRDVTDHLREALAGLPLQDAPLRVHVAGRLAASLSNVVGAQAEQRVLRAESIAMARRLGDEGALLSSLHAASGMFPEELDPRERFALFGEAIDLAHRLGRIVQVAPLLSWHVAAWLELGEPEGAARAADRAQELLAPFQNPELLWRAPLSRAMLALVAGRFDEADAHAERASSIALANGLVEGTMMVASYRSCVPYVRGDAIGALEALPLMEKAFLGAPLGEIFIAIAYAPLGYTERVRAAFQKLRTLPVEHVTGVATLGWPCARAGLVDDAALFYPLTIDRGRRMRISWAPGGTGTPGPTDLLVARLAALLGHRREADAAFGRAAAVARDVQSPPFIAQTAVEHAVLVVDEDRARAGELARLAIANAEPIGMHAVVQRAREIAGPMPISAASAPQAAWPATTPPGTTTARARLLRVARDGGLWILDAGAKPVRLKAQKGLVYLEALVQQPHKPIHALELVGVDEAGDAGPILDEEAKRAYRRRAAELRAALDDVDVAAAARARKELDALGSELARAFGLGGRERRAGSAAERARINVQRRLRDVIDKVSAQDRALGRHLVLSVSTGLLCMYAPTWPD